MFLSFQSCAFLFSVKIERWQITKYVHWTCPGSNMAFWSKNKILSAIRKFLLENISRSWQSFFPGMSDGLPSPDLCGRVYCSAPARRHIAPLLLQWEFHCFRSRRDKEEAEDGEEIQEYYSGMCDGIKRKQRTRKIVKTWADPPMPFETRRVWWTND